MAVGCRQLDSDWCLGFKLWGLGFGAPAWEPSPCRSAQCFALSGCGPPRINFGIKLTLGTSTFASTLGGSGTRVGGESARVRVAAHLRPSSIYADTKRCVSEKSIGLECTSVGGEAARVDVAAEERAVRVLHLLPGVRFRVEGCTASSSAKFEL